MFGQTLQHAQLTLSICIFMGCSIGMMLANKMAITVLPLQFTLVAMQMLFTVAFMLVFCSRSIRVGSWRDALLWSRDVPLFVGVLLTSILALKQAPMSVVIVFRCVTPIVSLAAERCFPKPVLVDAKMLVAIACMIGGVGMYVSEMPASNFAGAGWVLLNALFALGDRLLQRLMLAKDQQPVDISETGAALLNNLLGAAPMVAAALALGELPRIPGAFGQLGVAGCFWVALSCVCGMGISYMGFVVQRLVSATSVLVLLNVSKFVLIIIEYFCLSTRRLTPLQVAGALVAILGGAAYGKARADLQPLEPVDESKTLKGERSAKIV